MLCGICSSESQEFIVCRNCASERISVFVIVAKKYTASGEYIDVEILNSVFLRPDFIDEIWFKKASISRVPCCAFKDRREALLFVPCVALERNARIELAIRHEIEFLYKEN